MNFTELINQGKIKTIGRTYEKDNKFFMNFSGSGLMFNAITNKLIIKFFTYEYNDDSCPYVSVLIDNVRKDYKIDKENKEINLYYKSFKVKDLIKHVRFCHSLML